MQNAYPAFFALIVLVGVLLSLEIGRRAGVARVARDPEGAHRGTGPLESTLFALLGLLLAFTFNGAAERFQDRRQLMGEEATKIETAYLLLDLYPAGAREQLRAQFRAYVDSRIATYAKLPNVDAALAELPRTEALQDRIWAEATAGLRLPGAPEPQAILPHITAMFDARIRQIVATEIHPAPVIFGMLAGLTFLCSLLAGFALGASKKRHVLHVALFAVALTGTAYLILDTEYPSAGLIRVRDVGHVLVDLRNTMN
jgi:hypothetical protein